MTSAPLCSRFQPSAGQGLREQYCSRVVDRCKRGRSKWRQVTPEAELSGERRRWESGSPGCGPCTWQLRIRPSPGSRPRNRYRSGLRSRKCSGVERNLEFGVSRCRGNRSLVMAAVRAEAANQGLNQDRRVRFDHLAHRQSIAGSVVGSGGPTDGFQLSWFGRMIPGGRRNDGGPNWRPVRSDLSDSSWKSGDERVRRTAHVRSK